ncbi:hypothetical protein [Pseudomonas sp. R5(2019)]|uniref:hypothetical protein n=1 Tax=Pseudomonas sp. R5(2019) TaxID=2697566 RepID=UPI0014124444|nr:hypothetical protein [Pseudomonas sp. R5(2019)]NBA95982.1 hypothetical protein [Pseudomonas sp. R5(2019)]
MNLNDQPTVDELAKLFAARKDTLDNHILWVSESGTVQIDTLAPFTQESEFEQHTPALRARLKMYRRGQGYVGKKAAADKDFMARVLQTLKQEWQAIRDSSEVRRLDRYC